MTGIERLRELTNGINCSVWACTDSAYCEAHSLTGVNDGGRMRDALNDIADQIEREQDKVAMTDWEAMRDAADGKPLREGETVWDTNGDELVVGAFEDGGHTVTCRYADVGDAIPVHGMWSPSDLTHQRPVLDADGVLIKVGDTVYFTDGREQEFNTVVHAKYNYKDEPYVQLGRLNEVGYPTYTNCSCIDPSQLTHTKPEPIDTWERLEEDAAKDPCGYFGFDGEETCGKCPASGKNCEQTMARDIVRRCKELARKETNNE